MGKTILVADDSKTILKAIEMTFQATEFAVVTARSGDDALGQLDRVMPDVVLADCEMAGTDGYSMCARIKDAGHTVPVVLMASIAQPLDEQRAQMARANTSLNKPFDPKALIGMVRQLTGVEPAPDGPMTFADTLARRNRPDADEGGSPPAPHEGGEAAFVGSSDIIVDEPADQAAYADAAPDPDRPPAAPFGTSAPFEGPAEAPYDAAGGGMTAMPTGPTLEPPAPPAPFAPDGADTDARPPVDVWTLSEEPHGSGQDGIDDIQIEEESKAPVRPTGPAGERAPAPSMPGPDEPQDSVVTASALAALPAEELRAIAREVIEKTVRDVVQEVVREVVWEVVPELAETLIREEIKRLTDQAADGSGR